MHSNFRRKSKLELLRAGQIMFPFKFGNSPVILHTITGAIHVANSLGGSQSKYGYYFTAGVTIDRSCKCGQKTIDARIVGGVAAKVNEWPWQAGMVIGNSVFCGGSLICDQYVLTAAHCVEVI